MLALGSFCFQLCAAHVSTGSEQIWKKKMILIYSCSFRWMHQLLVNIFLVNIFSMNKSWFELITLWWSQIICFQQFWLNNSNEKLDQKWFNLSLPSPRWVTLPFMLPVTMATSRWWSSCCSSRPMSTAKLGWETPFWCDAEFQQFCVNALWWSFLLHQSFLPACNFVCSVPPAGLHPTAPGSPAGTHRHCDAATEAWSSAQWDNNGQRRSPTESLACSLSL